MASSLTPEQYASHARAAIDNPVLREIAADIESDAVSALAYAKAGEHEVRADKAAEIRAIRRLMQRLQSASNLTERPKGPTVA
jgi:hypothetical protein